MIYLDNGATSLHKPAEVGRAMQWALAHCANPGRGGHKGAMAAARTVYDCREKAADFFDCQPEQVVFTQNCTHGLNIAINTLCCSKRSFWQLYFLHFSKNCIEKSHKNKIIMY